MICFSVCLVALQPGCHLIVGQAATALKDLTLRNFTIACYLKTVFQYLLIVHMGQEIYHLTFALTGLAEYGSLNH